ncbi:hypothetical protein N2152v2_000438 [Parachlorella kessleri]
MSEPNRKSPKRTNKQCLHCGEPVPAKVFHQDEVLLLWVRCSEPEYVDGARVYRPSTRFQSLDEFDENKKSCRRTLIAHNERRRRHRSEAATVIQRPLYGSGPAAAGKAPRLAASGEQSGPEDVGTRLALVARVAQLDSEGSEETVSESEAAAAVAAAGQPAGAVQQSFSDTGGGHQSSNPARLPGLQQGHLQPLQKPRRYWAEEAAEQQVLPPQAPQQLEQQLSSGGATGNDRFFAEVLAAVPELRALLPEQQLPQQAGSRCQPVELPQGNSLGAADVEVVVQLLVTLLEKLVSEARPATTLRPMNQPAPIEPALSSALSSLCLLLEAHQAPSQAFSQQLLPPPPPALPSVRLPDMSAAAAAFALRPPQREVIAEQPLLPAFGSGAAPTTLPSFGSGGAFTPYVPRDLSGRLPSASSSDLTRQQQQQPAPLAPPAQQQPELLLLELANCSAQAAAEQAQQAQQRQREAAPAQQPAALHAGAASGRTAQSVSCQWQPGAVPQSPFVAYNIQPAGSVAAALGPLASVAAQPQQAAVAQQLYQQLSTLLLRQQEQEQLQQGQQQLLPGHLASGELQMSMWRGPAGRSAAHS